jgi:hypothetical protein
MDSLHDVARCLIENKAVCFSCRLAGSPSERLSLSVKECEEHDLAEYDVPFERGGYFEIGPAKPKLASMFVNMAFKDVREAGDAILQARVELLGI